MNLQSEVVINEMRIAAEPGAVYQIKAELKMDLILLLAEHGYPPVTKDEIFKEIFEQTENFKKYSKE